MTLAIRDGNIVDEDDTIKIDKIESINVEEGDVLVMTVDNRYFKPHSVESLRSFIKRFEDTLPYNNKVIVVPRVMDMEMKVIKKFEDDFDGAIDSINSI